MVSTVKARIDGMVDSPNFKWGLAGMAVLGAILLVAGQFAVSKTVMRGDSAAGAILLGLAAAGGAYKLKRMWDAHQSKVVNDDADGSAEALMNEKPGRARITREGFEGVTDPSMTIVKRGNKVLGIPGMRAHPTARTTNDEL